MKKTLKLTIKKKWYDMILSGIKKEEYRETKNYWEKRLASFLNPIDIKYDSIEFYNGAYFGKDLPHFKIELVGVWIKEGNPEWGAEEGVTYFVLELGKIIDKSCAYKNAA